MCWYLWGSPVLFLLRCHCEKGKTSGGSDSQRYCSMLALLSIFHVTFRMEQFYPEQWESKGLNFSPMPLAEDYEHSLLLLYFGFLSIWDLWEHIWKTVFCTSCSGTWCMDIPLKNATCHQNTLVQYMIKIQFDYHYPKERIHYIYIL